MLFRSDSRTELEWEIDTTEIHKCRTFGRQSPSGLIETKIIEVCFKPGLPIVLILNAPKDGVPDRREHPERLGYRLHEKGADTPPPLLRQVPMGSHKRVSRVSKSFRAMSRRLPKSNVMRPRCRSVRRPVLKTFSSFTAINACNKRSPLTREGLSVDASTLSSSTPAEFCPSTKNRKTFQSTPTRRRDRG